MKNSILNMSHVNNTSSSKEYWQSCSLHNAKYAMVLNFPSQKYYNNYVIGLICNIIVIISTIFLNTVTILAYWRSARLRAKTSYFLVLLLSVTDLITGVIGHPIYVLTLALTINGSPNCTIHIVHEIVTFSTGGMSFTTLLALNLERHLSIVYPIFHRTKMTKQRITALTAVLWSNSVGLTLLYPSLGDVARPLTSLSISLAILTTVYMYVSIYLANRRTMHSSRARENQVKQLQNLRMTKSCAIVVVCTIICYLPFAVIRSLQRNFFATLFMELWGKTLTLISSSLNSIVFFWRNPILRQEARVLFRKSS